MKRVFIAVDINEEIRKTVSDYIDELRRAFPRSRVGWERPEKLHLTLKFLGSVDESVLMELSGAVRATADSHEAFDVRIAGTGVFPSPRNPRVLWVGVSEETGKFATLAKSVEDTCRRFGFEPDNRKFHPHLTIARIKDPHGARELGEYHSSQKLVSMNLDVRQLAVYESKLAPTGSRYFKLAECPLRGSE